MAHASTARISSASQSGSSQAGRLIGAARPPPPRCPCASTRPRG
jgi:hypothetical protein